MTHCSRQPIKTSRCHISDLEPENPFVDAWKGYTKLWVVYWICGVAAIFVIDPLLFDLATRVGQWLEWVLLPIVIAYAVWVLVATWRCASNCNWQGWGFLARLSVVGSVLWAMWDIGQLILN